MIKNNGSILFLKKIWIKYVYQYKYLLLLAIVLMIVASIMDALSVKILEPVFNEIFIEKNKSVLHLIALQILSIFFIKCCAQYFQSMIMLYIGTQIVKEIQLDLYRHIIYMDVDFFSKKNSSDLLNNFVNDIYGVRNTIVDGITMLFKSAFTVLFLVILMFYKNFEMALVTSILWPIAFWPMIRLGKLIRQKTIR